MRYGIIVSPCVVQCGDTHVEVEPSHIPWESPTFWIVRPTTTGYQRIRKAEMSVNPNGTWEAE